MITSLMAFLNWLAEPAWAQLWQVTALAVVVGLIVRIACRHRPHLAYLLWMIVVIKCVTPPLVASPTSPFSWLRQVNAAPDANTSPNREPPALRAAGQNLERIPSEQDFPERRRTASGNPQASAFAWVESGHLLLVLAVLWSVGVGLLSLRIGFKWWALKRLCNTVIEPPALLQDQLRQLAGRLSIRREVRLVVVREPVRPAVFGVFRPSILLPATLIENASAETLEAILAHELIHVRRGDPAASALQLAAQVLWWFHPLVWWTNREARRERERACDEEVVSGLDYSPTRYARMLIDLLASFTEPQRLVVPGSVTMLGFTARRLEHLLRDTTRFHRRTPRGYWLIACVVLIVALPGAGLRWRNAEVEARAGETPPPARHQAETKPRSNDQPAVTGSASPVNGTFIADESDANDGNPVPDGQTITMPASTDADNEAHRRAVAEIKRLGGGVFRQRDPDGKVKLLVLLSQVKGSNTVNAISQLKDLTDLHLVVVDCRQVAPEGLAKLKALPALQSLNLDHVTDAQIAQLQGWMGLTTLQMISDNFSDVGLTTVATMPRLETLIIGSLTPPEKQVTHSITDVGIATLKGLKNLKLLSVGGFPGVKGSGFKQLWESSKLHELHLFGVPLDNEGIDSVARLPHLKTLSVDATNLPVSAFSSLEELTLIERLSLFGAQGFDDSAASHLEKLTNLRQLDLSNSKLTDAGLAHVEGLTKLRQLVISNGSFTDAGLAHLQNLLELRTLSLSADLDVGDDGLKHLVGLIHLKTLDLPGKRISDKGLANLAVMSDLQALSLEKSRIQGPGLAQLRGLKKLKQLNLGQTLIEDNQLAQLVELPALEELDLEMTGVSDAGLESIGKLAKLKSLNLMGTKVSDDGLGKLAGLKKLQTLRVLGTAITKDGKKKLNKLLPKLTIDLEGNDWFSLEAFPDETEEPLEAERAAEPQIQVKPAEAAPAEPAKGTLETEGPPITGEFIPSPEIPAATEADTDAHRRAVAEIKKLGGRVVRQRDSDGQVSLFVDLSQQTSGGDECIAHLKDLTGLNVVLVNGQQVTPVVFAKLKDLQTLKKVVLHQVTDQQLVSLRGWKGIVQLDLQSDAISDAGLETIATMAELEELLISGQWGSNKTAKITDSGIASLKSLKVLKQLIIGACPDVKGTGLAALSELPKLETVVTNRVSLDGSGIAAMASLPHLKTLMVDATGLPSAAFAALKQLTSVEQLSLQDAKTFTDEAAASLAKLDNLRQLGLYDAALTDQGLAHLQDLTELRSLHIWKGSFSDAGLGHLKGLIELRTLVLSADLDVGDEGLKALAQMKQLKSLELPGKRITDDGLAALSALTNLQSLNLEKTRIRGSGLKHGPVIIFVSYEQGTSFAIELGHSVFV